MEVYLVWCCEYDDAELMGLFKFSSKAEEMVHSLAAEYNRAHVAETDEYPPMEIVKTSDGFVGYSSLDWSRRVVMGVFHVNEETP